MHFINNVGVDVTLLNQHTKLAISLEVVKF